MAEPGPGGGGNDGWPPGVAPSQPPPTVPFAVPPPPPPPAYPMAYQPLGHQPMYQPYAPPVLEPPKSKITAALLAFFLGVLGIHNFYLGRIGLGTAQLLIATLLGMITCGLATLAVAVWAFVEFIVILCGGIRDGHGRPLV